MPLKRFITLSVFRLWKINIAVIIFILIFSLFSGYKVTDRTRMFDFSIIKPMHDILLYFIQPACSVLLFWTNLLTGKINNGKNTKCIFNPNILLIVLIYPLTAAILFLNGSFYLLTDNGVFKTIFNILYWLFNIIFILFTAKDILYFKANKNPERNK